jgi:hypothetical protein
MATPDYAFCKEGTCPFDDCDATCPHHGDHGKPTWVDCANVSAQADGEDIKDPCGSGPPADHCSTDCPFYGDKLAGWEWEIECELDSALDPTSTDNVPDVPF